MAGSMQNDPIGSAGVTRQVDTEFLQIEPEKLTDATYTFDLTAALGQTVTVELQTAPPEGDWVTVDEISNHSDLLSGLLNIQVTATKSVRTWVLPNYRTRLKTTNVGGGTITLVQQNEVRFNAI